MLSRNSLHPPKQTSHGLHAAGLHKEPLSLQKATIPDVLFLHLHAASVQLPKPQQQGRQPQPLPDCKQPI